MTQIMAGCGFVVMMEEIVPSKFKKKLLYLRLHLQTVNFQLLPFLVGLQTFIHF